MKHPGPYSAKLRQFKSLSKKINHLISIGQFFRLSKKVQDKLIYSLRKLYLQLTEAFSVQSLKKILASAAVLLGIELAGQSQIFAPPVVDTLGLDTGSVYWKCPDLVDLDGDGDFDLLTGEIEGAFKYLENTGSPQMPYFPIEITNPFNLDSFDIVNYPVSGDLDNDGDFDVIGVDENTNVRYFENVGNPQSPDFFDRGFNPFGIIPGYLFYKDFFYMPSLVDLDNDGDLDLIIGAAFYDQVYYENTGTPSAPSFANPEKNSFGLPRDSYAYFVSQTLADFDNDGDYDMVTVATTSLFDKSNNDDYYGSVFKYYENIGTATSPLFDKPASSKFLTDTLKNTFSIGLTAADIDDDGDVDMIFFRYTYDYNSGSGYAGLSYVENMQNPMGLAGVSEVELSISPNPASDYVQIRISNSDPKNGPEWFELISQNGQRLVSHSYFGDDISLDVRSLPAGNYYLIARRDSRAIGTKKVVISR